MPAPKIEEVVKALKWAEEEVKEFERAANQTWDVIARDVMECGEQETMSSKDVFYITIDADHMCTHTKYPKDKMERVYNLTSKQKDILRKYCFPYRAYGL